MMKTFFCNEEEKKNEKQMFSVVVNLGARAKKSNECLSFLPSDIFGFVK